MAGTLVIDHDGVYDPSLLNDRLLLGLKGTMSEFEISLLRQRAMEARRQKVGRGLVLTQVPVGYVRTEDEGIEKTPNRQIQEAIAGIFRKFRELGSVRQVLLWYRDEKLLIPALSRESGNRKVVWIEPVYPRIFGILKNPTYAGVFVWGRNHTRTSIVDGRARKTRSHARPLEQWEVTIPDHHEGYITWEEFMRNQQQIRSNAGWNARMGSANGAVEKRSRIAGRTAALRSLWTRTPGLLYPQQATWPVAALLVCWRSRSSDGSHLHYLRWHTCRSVGRRRSPRSPAPTGRPGGARRSGS